MTVPGAPLPEPEATPARRTEIVVSAATVVKALAIFFGIILVFIAAEALLSIALALVMVLGLDPPVAALERRGWGRGKAALVVFGAVVLTVFILVVWAVKPLWANIADFIGKLPSMVQEANENTPIKQLDDGTDAAQKLQSLLADAAEQLPSTAKHLLGALVGAVGSLFSLVTLAFLTLFGLIAKPALTRSTLELMPPKQARHVGQTFDEVTRTVSFSLIGNVVISIIAGSVVGLAAVLVDAPNPAVLALIVGLFDLIPQIGSTIAAVIVVTVTLIATGAGAAVVMLAVILVYQQVENYLIQPAVMRQAVELSGFATIASVILGSALLGVVGAILAVPVAASVKVVMREVTAPRRARMALLEDPPADTTRA